MGTIRTFIAVDVSPKSADRASDLINRLQAAAAGVKWVEPKNLHLTLKFLGDVPEAETPEVCRSVARAVAEFAAFEISLRGAGAFPSRQRPRTLWIGVGEGLERLRALHAAVDSVLAKLRFPKERRPFHPHLTIGRVRRGGPELRGLPELLEKNDRFDVGKSIVTEVITYASFLDKRGPTYEALGRSPLLAQEH